jgi:hypothetical protein
VRNGTQPASNAITLDVREGSNSEVELADADFRFTPESRHPAGRLGCPFSARFGHRDASLRSLHLW